jgi:hypothetical protein
LKRTNARINNFSKQVFIFCLVSSCFLENCFGQAELQAWGNMTGIRVQGELMGFESSLRVVGKQWTSINATGKEQQSPKFSRDSGSQVVVTRLGNIQFTEKITDAGQGIARVSVRTVAASDTTLTGAFFCISLSYKEYGGGTLVIDQAKPLRIESLKPDSNGELLNITSTSLRVQSAQRQFNIKWQKEGTLIIRQASGTDGRFLDFYIPLVTGDLIAGQNLEKTFVIGVSGPVDRKDIHLKLDLAHPGREFAGLGGNFRIQNLKTDPQVIEYCLKNLRVAWGRVEMPWRFWQPEKNSDPVAAAKSGHLDPHVQRAMEMAQKLQQRGIPIILTDWSAPDWAIVGKPVFQHQNGQPWGNPLNRDSLTAIYKSIADYIQYLQEQYGVRIRFFSFNESDLGIYVRQTGEQHADLIKGLGEYFLSRGIQTKILLGDNSDATSYTFIDPAMRDSSTYPYMGAISFHSWRGWDTETLLHWTDASRRMKLPLIVGEGSIDAAAWAYPAIFLEPTYAMEEINLYIRLMSICEPLSILQWQLTSDYSPLSGGGIFGKEGPLEPTQRFWNLKQLSSTPEGLNYFPVFCDRPKVTCAGLGSSRTGNYVLHIVNNGAARKVKLSGIPAGLRSFKIFSTGKSKSMEEGQPVTISKGLATFLLPPDCFTTLTTQQ